MKPNLGKIIRTLQSEVSFLKGTKDLFYYHCREVFRKPHDDDFRSLRHVPDGLAGSYLDIGANQGQSIQSIKLLKPSARIYSFEANRPLAEKLQRRYTGRDDITVMAYGLAEQSERRNLFIPVYKKFVYDGLASFDIANASAWLSPETLHFFSPAKLKIMETTCTTERLDDLKLEPLFIKIDVQGYEHQVVKGGIETIKRYEPIIMVEDFTGPLAQLLRQLGYEQYLFDDSGFYRADFNGVVNTLLMPKRRAALVTLSKRHPPRLSSVSAASG